MSRLRDERGFTLIEMIVTVAILTVVLGLVLGAFEVFARQNGSTQRQGDAQDEARQATDRLAGRLRNAVTTASGAVELANPSDLVFVTVDPMGSSTATDRKGYVHQRYCLNTSTLSAEVLYRQIAPYSDSSSAMPATGGACPSTVNGWAAGTPLATHLVNQYVSPAQPLFSYTFGSDGVSVTSVLIHTVVQANPSQARPGPTDLQTAVSLRNGNQPPIASLTCQVAATTGRVSCNASASSDPDGQFVTYAWAINGAAQAGNYSYRLDAGVQPSGTAITVTVADAAGSTSTATYTVP